MKPFIRVKICGLTSVDDALHACHSGADAIGLVFYAKSSRAVSIEQASGIAASLPPFVQRVALFVNETKEKVQSVLEAVDIDLLQFHGDEDCRYCESFSRPYIKALRMKPGLDVEAAMAAYPSAKGFLLDAYTPGIPGGTGQTFNWQEFPKQTNKPVILAGGLHADNVAEAIAICQPYAVDVSGGVEISPGKKSQDKVKTFVSNAKRRCHGNKNAKRG